MRRLLIVVVCFATLLPGTLMAHGSAEVDLLIDRLVEKGLLTEDDARELAQDLRGQKPALAVQELPDAPVATPSAPAAQEPPRFTVKGDMRVRYQSDSLEMDADDPALDVEAEDRMRIRWRLGTEARVTEAWQVGFGLSSGGTDPRSSNATLDDAFSRGDARLDYAFARYAPTGALDVLAGKFKNPIWTPGDLLWDSDIRPEGGAVHYTSEFSDRLTAFVTPAYLELSSSVEGGRDEARMWLVQAGVTMALNERVSLTVAPAYYQFANLQGGAAPVSVDVPSNSRDVDGNYRYDYDSIGLGGSFAVVDVGPLPALEVYGEYVSAFDPDEANTGYLAGIGLGDAGISGWADWRVDYRYRRLERDAWPEFFADSDAFFGATNAKGGEVQFDFGLARNVWFTINYYGNASYLGADIEQDLLQLDLNLVW